MRGRKLIETNELWAKLNPFESVESHMLKAGRVCKELLIDSSLKYVVDTLFKFVETDLDNIEFINFISYIVAMHDVGKATSFFQAKADKQYDIVDRLKECGMYQFPLGECRHELYSKVELRRLLPKHMKVENDEVVIDLSNVLGYHHYKEPSCRQNIDKNWKLVIDEIESMMYTEFKFIDITKFEVSHKAAFYNLLLGILVISDWIASSTEISALSLSAFSSRQDIHKYLVEYGFGDTLIDFKSYGYAKLLLNNSLKLRPLQQWTLDYQNYAKTKFMLIEAGTGEGKTSVALYSAFQMMKESEGFYYALPMEVMVNSKYEEVCGILKDKPVTLLHRNRELVEGADEVYTHFDNFLDKDIEVSDFLTASSRQGLLNKYIVGTVDQLLYSVLSCKFNALRLLGLINKTIILDEIHAYDAYTGELICKLLELCRVYGLRVIVMTATLSSCLKEKYLSAYLGKSVKVQSNGYPLVTLVDDTDTLREYEVAGSEKRRTYAIEQYAILSDIEKQCNMILDAYTTYGGAIIVYKNTVKKAQELYDRLLAKGVTDILLCHSRFKLKDRKQHEDKALSMFGKGAVNRPDRYIVIATQVLEACLDLSFDICFSDIAPFDILVQRLGRVCRFEVANICAKRGTLYLFKGESCDYGNSAYVYQEILLAQTEAYLLKKSSLSLPDELRCGIESVYNSKVVNSDDFFEAYCEKLLKDSSMKHMAREALISFEPDKFKLDLGVKHVSTRSADPVTLVLVDLDEDKTYDYNKLSLSEYKQLVLNSFNYNYFQLPDKLEPMSRGRLKGKYVLGMKGGKYITEKKIYCYDSEKGFRVIK